MPPKGHYSLKRKKGFHIYGLMLSEYPTDSQDQIHDRVWEDREKWEKDFNWSAPESSSTSKRYIKDIRDADSRKWLDSAWHTGIFAFNDSYELEFPHDQLPVVMQTAMRAFAGGKLLTARQAMWVARLNALMRLDPAQATDVQIEDIYSLAITYSAREIAVAAIAHTISPGQRVLPSGQESDADTWPLDVFVALTETVVAPAWTLYEVLLEAGFVAELIWPPKITLRMEITPTSEQVKPLYRLLLDETPGLLESCKAMILALLWIRAYAERQFEYGTRWVDPEIPVDRAAARAALDRTQTDEERHESIISLMASGPMLLSEPMKAEREWGSLSDDEQKEKARKIGCQALKVIEAEKQKTEQIEQQKAKEEAREIATQVMELIEKQKETDSDN